MCKSSYSTATCFRRSFLLLNFSLILLIGLTRFATTALGQVIIPVQELSPNLFNILNGTQPAIEAVGDQLLIGTAKGLWILNGDGKVREIDGPKGDSLMVTTVDNTLFIGADNGLWILGKDNKATKVFDFNASRPYLFVVGNSLLINRNDDSHNLERWLISASGKATKIEGIKGRYAQAKSLGDRFFFKTDEALWFVDRNGTANRFEKIKAKISKIVAGKDLLLASGQDGLWVVDVKDNVTKVKDLTGSFYDIRTFGDGFYVATDNGFWIVSKEGNPQKVENVKGQSGFPITAMDDRVLVINDNGASIVDKAGIATRVEGIGPPDVRDQSISIFEVSNDRFIITAIDNAWIVGKDGKATKVEGIRENTDTDLRVPNIWSRAEDDQFFLSTDKDLWAVSKSGKAVHVEHVQGQVNSVKSIGRLAYINTSEKLYLLDQKAKIETKLTPTGWWSSALGYVLPDTWLPVGKVEATAAYSDEITKGPFGKTIPREFRFAKSDDDRMPSDDKFSPRDQFRYDLGWGKHDAHYWVKDKWGNTFEQTGVYRGVPSEYLSALLPFTISAIFVLSCFALAPKVGFCHSAIMNPWLRKYFSLGSVPLLLSVFPSLRRYVLRRYAAAIRNDNDFAEWKKRFVYPDPDFQPENFGRKLESERRLLLTGRSGIGKTSFFKNLTAHYASEQDSLTPANVFPVYIPLTNYGGNSLEDLVYNQLFSHGKITDTELAPMFLEQGGLLIFLDGVNEVQNVADRQRLSEFIRKFGSTNYMCLSSQQSYPEIDSIPKLELKTFSKEKVNEFLRQRVNEKKIAENVISGLTEEDYQLYSVPRDLEFAVEILNSGKQSLPKSRTELYRTVFTSLFSEWKENGNLDAEDLLCERAYMMIMQRDLAFDVVDKPRYREITTDLSEQKFLIQRENNYNFRHDLIRAYLASQYFYSRWASLLDALTGKPIDSNWLEMLKFSCEHIDDSNEVKSLTYKVLEKSIRKDVVKKMFEWLKANYPDRCKSWETDFYARYGALDFETDKPVDSLKLSSDYTQKSVQSVDGFH